MLSEKEMEEKILNSYGFIEMYNDEFHQELVGVEFCKTQEDFDKEMNRIDTEGFYYQSYLLN